MTNTVRYPNKLLTRQQQIEALMQAEMFFDRLQYSQAEPLYDLVRESALQCNYYDIYVSAVLNINRIYVHTFRYENLYQNLLLIHPFIEQYATVEETFKYRTQLAALNSHYYIGDMIQEVATIKEDLKDTAYKHLYYLVCNNLMYNYLQQSEPERAFEVFEQMNPSEMIQDKKSATSVFMYFMHGFAIYYARGDYDTCESILKTVRTDKQIMIPDFFRTTYEVSEILLEARIGHIEKAKEKFELLFESDPVYFHKIQFHMRLWLDTLTAFNLKDEVIRCQRRIIQMLEAQYTSEIRNLRKESIEYYSKQFYETQIYVDQMTGVKNRNFFEVFIEKMEQVKNYTIVVLDIDKFKNVNDTYGHPIGDEAIQFIAKQLLDWCPIHDMHIIRYGGDEFILLIPHPVEKVAPALAQVHETICTTPLITQQEKIEVPLSISMGVCYTNAQVTSIDQLFTQADEAIYEAKKERGCIVSHPFKVEKAT